MFELKGTNRRGSSMPHLNCFVLILTQNTQMFFIKIICFPFSNLSRTSSWDYQKW